MPITFNVSQTEPATPAYPDGPGTAIPGADYSMPVDHRGGVIGEEIWYRDGFGNELNLSTIVDEQYKQGITGRFGAPVEHFSQAVPEQDGERYRGTRVLPSQIVIPITLVADNITELRGKVRELSRALTPKRGVGKLHVVTLDGLHRYLNCIPETVEAEDPGVVGEEYDAQVDVTFRAFDPYWYDAIPVTRTWYDATSPGTFFPLLPVRLGASSIFGVFDEDNEGEAEAWPIWAIRGPGIEFQFTNETTRQYSAITLDIPAGEVLIIDTRPGIKEVYFEGRREQTLFPYLLGSLWPLEEGTNKITVQIKESNDETAVRFSYNPKFLGI